jgi:hypothetical protein
MGHYMIGGKNLLSAVAAVIGTAASGVAIVDYFYPHQTTAEKPPVTAPTTITPSPPAAVAAEQVAVSLPKPTIAPQVQVTPPRQDPPPTPVPAPNKALAPAQIEESDACALYTEYDGKRSFSVKTGLEVCDETGRLIASVKKVIVDGFPDYIGVKFTVPGKSDVFCWNEAKSCKIPFAPDRSYYIERLKSTVNGGVATFRAVQ